MVTAFQYDGMTRAGSIVATALWNDEEPITASPCRWRVRSTMAGVRSVAVTSTPAGMNARSDPVPHPSMSTRSPRSSVSFASPQLSNTSARASIWRVSGWVMPSRRLASRMPTASVVKRLA